MQVGIYIGGKLSEVKRSFRELFKEKKILICISFFKQVVY